MVITYTKAGHPTAASVKRVERVVKALARLGMPEVTDARRLLQRLRRLRRK
jgi:hypothetical protein